MSLRAIEGVKVTMTDGRTETVDGWADTAHPGLVLTPALGIAGSWNVTHARSTQRVNQRPFPSRAQAHRALVEIASIPVPWDMGAVDTYLAIPEQVREALRRCLLAMAKFRANHPNVDACRMDLAAAIGRAEW